MNECVYFIVRETIEKEGTMMNLVGTRCKNMFCADLESDDWDIKNCPYCGYRIQAIYVDKIERRNGVIYGY